MLEEKKVRKQKLWLEPDFADTDANVFETARGCVLGSNTSTEQGGEAAAGAILKNVRKELWSPLQ